MALGLVKGTGGNPWSFLAANAPAQSASLEDDWRPFVPAEMRQLPLGVQRWYVYETVFLSRIVDTSILHSPAENEQLKEFTPEAHKVFRLPGYWLPEDMLATYEYELPHYLNKFLIRERNGRREFLFFIHPESRDHYPLILNTEFEKEEFLAAATASSRSLLVWKPGFEKEPFIAKVSLFKKIGGVIRSVLASETIYSVAVTEMLDKSENLPNNAVFMREALGLVPKGASEGGMLIRVFPESILSNPSISFVPFFAFYANADDSHLGLLLSLIKHSDLDAETFVRLKIIRPFLEVWLKLILTQDFTMEPHAQNMLQVMYDNSLSTDFVFRDNGGYVVDENARAERHLFFPKGAKDFDGLPTGVFARDLNERSSHAIRSYFGGGFLFNVELAVLRWQRKSWLPGKLAAGWVNRVLKEELTRVLSLQNSEVLGEYYENLESIVEQARLARINNLGVCRSIFH